MQTPFLFLMLVGHFRLGMTLHCYQCNSETHRRCLSEDLLIDKFLIECVPSKFNYSGHKPIPFCSKINQWLYFTKKSRKAVIRGCNYYHKYKDKCDTYSDRDSYVTVCMCGAEGCNSVLGTRLSIILIFLVILRLFSAFINVFPTST